MMLWPCDAPDLYAKATDEDRLVVLHRRAKQFKPAILRGAAARSARLAKSACNIANTAANSSSPTNRAQQRAHQR